MTADSDFPLEADYKNLSPDSDVNLGMASSGGAWMPRNLPPPPDSMSLITDEDPLLGEKTLEGPLGRWAVHLPPRH